MDKDNQIVENQAVGRMGLRFTIHIWLEERAVRDQVLRRTPDRLRRKVVCEL